MMNENNGGDSLPEQSRKDREYDAYSGADLQIHETIMNSLIKKYNPNPKDKVVFNVNDISKDGIREIGLERIAKDLVQLSNNRLTEL